MFNLTRLLSFCLLNCRLSKYFRCTGRFETLFSPLHPDQTGEGWPKRDRYCVTLGKWVQMSDSSTLEFYLSFSWLISCKSSLYITRIVLFGLPEIVLYYKIFRHVKRQHHKTALLGIVSQDTVKRRKQQNKLNIMVTFWAWMAQFITNIIYIFLMSAYFGKSRFYHTLLAICTICLNFNILPLFFICMADDDFKVAIQGHNFTAIIKLLCGISSS